MLLLLVGEMTTCVQSQEAIRMSMAGAQAAEARHKATLTTGYDNIRLGPTLWRFGTGVGLAYDDNITLTQIGQEGDFILSPRVNAQLIWPVTEKISLNLTLGAGYSAYMQHSKLDRAFITPNSELSFDVYVGDFQINLHDRFSITENSYQDPTLAANGDYSQFQNTLGVSTVWDLNKLVVNFGYDHGTYLEVAGGEGVPDRSSEIFSASTGYALKPGMLLGLEFGGDLLHNSSTTTNIPYTDASQWNAGAFFQTQVSEHLAVKADAGYDVNSPYATGALKTSQDFVGYYAQLTLTHHLNRFVDYSLNCGRILNSSLFGGTVDMYVANLSANWKIFQKTSLATSFIYQHGSQVILEGETFDQYGPQITLGRPITRKLSSALMYQFYKRGSDQVGRDYTLNVVTVDLNYQF